MAVKLTKNELKVQKDRLKQFQRYLPTLQLKKQQLQSVVMQVTAQLERVEAERLKIVDGLDGWIAVFAENGSFPEGKLPFFNACAAVRPPAGLWGEYRPVQPFPADRYGGRGR